MKKTILCALAAGAFVFTGATARADHDEDYDGVTRVDRYHDADVVHYDHHHRQYYTDDYGNVIEQTVHHDHHYVEPRYRRHHHQQRRFFFGGW